MKLVEGMRIRYRGWDEDFLVVSSADRLWIKRTKTKGAPYHPPTGQPEGAFSDSEESIQRRLTDGSAKLVGGLDVQWHPSALEEAQL